MESAWISITLIAMRTSRVPLALLASLQSTARRASCCAQAYLRKDGSTSFHAAAFAPDAHLRGC